MYYSLPARTFALVVMVTFLTGSLLLFSLYIDLKPAKAFIFADIKAFIQRIVLNLKTELRDFAKGVAQAFVVTFIANMAVKLLKELEKFHIIKNIADYSDALGYYEHLPKLLNKIIDKPREPGDLNDPKLQKDLGQLAEEANKLPFNSLRRGQVTALALANSPYKVTSVNFYTDRPSIQKGQTANIFWEVDGENIYIKVDDKNVDFISAMTVSPSQSKYYTLTIWNATTGQPTGYPVAPIEIKVNNQKAPEPNPVPPAPTAKKGLTESQEKQILKGGISLLTSQIACGGTNLQAIKNLSIYQAAKYRGLDPRNIDPRQGNFYTGMLRYGDPFSNPYFQELTLRDMAATLEAKSRVAVQTELTSNGLKSLRAEQNQISRTSQTVADFIGQSAGTALNAGLQGSNAGFAAKAIGQTLANIVTAALFNQKGKVLQENPFCGIAQLAAAEFIDPALNFGNGIVSGSANPFVKGFIRFKDNGSDTIEVANPNTIVTLEWSIGDTNRKGQAFINGSPVAKSSPPTRDELIDKDKEFKLSFTDGEPENNLGSVDIAVAIATIKPPGSTGGTTPPPQEVFEFSTNRPTVKGDGIDPALLNWKAEGFQNLFSITIRDITANRDVGTFHTFPNGSFEVKPIQKTEYRATLNGVQGAPLGQKTVIIDVLQATKSDYISAPFSVKPRE